MMKRISSITIILILAVSLLSNIPFSLGISKISVNVDKEVYFAGDSVYVFGSVTNIEDPSNRASVEVESPSGTIWASVSVVTDSSGSFGTTIGAISNLDSTGTYIVSVIIGSIKNTTTFQVKTEHYISVETDKKVYLDSESITVLGRVSPLIEGYFVTIRITENSTCEIDCIISVAQTSPAKDGKYIAENVHDIQSEDFGQWVINVTYGPMASNKVIIYVGLKISVDIEKNEYLPGDIANVSGTVSPVVSGRVNIIIKNPSGGIWLDDEVFPNSEGKYLIEQIVFPGDQIGEYSVKAVYWGVTNDTRFFLGQLGDSTMKITKSSINGVNNANGAIFFEGSPISINIELINKDIITHEFLLIVQIKDLSGKMIFIACQTSILNSGETADLTAGQPFWDKDTYEVKVLVWDNWDKANALSEEKIMSFQVV